MEDETKRIGSVGLESKLIGTVAKCNICKPSDNWLGKYSPLLNIHNGKLWLTQHLNTIEISSEERDTFLTSISNTKKWIN